MGRIVYIHHEQTEHTAKLALFCFLCYNICMNNIHVVRYDVAINLDDFARINHIYNNLGQLAQYSSEITADDLLEVMETKDPSVFDMRLTHKGAQSVLNYCGVEADGTIFGYFDNPDDPMGTYITDQEAPIETTSNNFAALRATDATELPFGIIEVHFCEDRSGPGEDKLYDKTEYFTNRNYNAVE